MKDYIVNETNKYISKASDIYGRYFPEIPVKFKLRGKSAGQFCFGVSGDHFNYNIDMAMSNKNTFDRTIVHEVAHYIARSLSSHGIKPHGREWRGVMRSLGVANPTRCHSYEMPDNVKRNQYKYECGCHTHYVSKIIHSKILSGQVRTCKKCKKQLKRA